MNITLKQTIDNQNLLRYVGVSAKCLVTGKAYTGEDVEMSERLMELDHLPEGARVLVLHDKDQDGTVASMVLKKYLSEIPAVEKITTVGLWHGASFKNLAVGEARAFGRGNVVFVLDQSFNKEIYEALITLFDLVFWIDHHPVSVVENCEVGQGDVFYINDVYSTAMLVWNMVFLIWQRREPNRRVFAMAMLSYLTHFYDSWQFSKGAGDLHERFSSDAKALSAWWSLEPDHVNIIEAIFSEDVPDEEGVDIIHRLCDAGQALIMSRAMIQKQVIASFTGRVKWTLEGIEYRVAFALHSDARSALSNDILEELGDSIDVAMVVFYAADSKEFRFSLRGRDSGPSVETLCAYLGGGGHRNAAGFSVKSHSLGMYLHDRVFSSMVGGCDGGV